MPLRYKKFILIFTLAVMFIGMGTFSLLAPELNFSLPTSQENLGKKDVLQGMSSKDIKQEITDLVQIYFDAKLKVDMTILADCVTDIENVDERKLVAEAEYIEKYQNISCTIKDGTEKGSYRVYVYHEDKYYDIDKAIPSLTALYVKVQDDGKFMLHYGTLTGKEQKKIAELDDSTEVKKLKDSVNKKLEELKSTDEQVREFCEMLDNSSQDETENTENIQNEAGSANGEIQAPQAGAATQAPAGQTATQAPAGQAATQAPPAGEATQAPAAAPAQ
ncbi:MAG: hypothetical protein J1E62_00075 [Lachnospiraceae bacterium]|nr:hypothetical protein [Lachnospiraceae bacterium]